MSVKAYLLHLAGKSRFGPIGKSYTKGAWSLLGITDIASPCVKEGRGEACEWTGRKARPNHRRSQITRSL
jgi:hypothetical protein